MIQLYTDGSFVKEDANQKRAHGGCFIYWRDKNNEPQMKQYHFTCKNSTYASSRNVSGELLAVVQGLKRVVELCDPDEILLTYDYEGVGKWANGQWKTNKGLTIGYAKMMRDFVIAHPNYPIKWRWVHGHDGDVGNEYADKCATVRDETSARNNNVEWIDEDPKFC